MPRVIFKCPYLKGGGASAEHRRFYVKYITAREGIQKTDESCGLLSATKKQESQLSQEESGRRSRAGFTAAGRRPSGFAHHSKGSDAK